MSPPKELGGCSLRRELLLNGLIRVSFVNTRKTRETFV